jgi:hypothetical protein
LLGLVISTLMITPLSKPLWDHLPLLPMVQFPWRFLSVQALFAAAALGMIPHSTPGSLRRRQGWGEALCGLILMAAVLVPLHPDRLPIGPEDVTRERLLLYELFTSNIGTTIRHEYLYRAVVPRPFTSDAAIEPDAPPRAIPLDGARLEAEQVESAPTRQVWRVAGEGGGIAFPILYWPGWRARVDGEPVDVGPVEGPATWPCGVPPGEHTVVLYLGRTPVRALAEGVSLAAALGMMVVAAGRHLSPPSPCPALHPLHSGGHHHIPQLGRFARDSTAWASGRLRGQKSRYIFGRSGFAEGGWGRNEGPSDHGLHPDALPPPQPPGGPV